MSKLRYLLDWQKRGLTITIEGTRKQPFISGADYFAAEWSAGSHSATIDAVNAHWVTFNLYRTPRELKSEPMEKILLSQDDQNRRPKVVLLNWS
jgi:hypothetical protein